MKIICKKEKLMEGINTVQRAVSTKTNYSILEGILLECTDKFKLTGNDLEIGIEYIVEAVILRKGSIIINSKIFGEIVRRLPDSDILLELEENSTLIIECEKSYFELNGILPNGYPKIPSIEEQNKFEIAQKTLREMIRQTIFSVGVDENKPILTGSLIECNRSEINMVAIDGFRIALRKNQNENTEINFNVIVPGKTLNELAKILQPIDDKIQIYLSDSQILFKFSNFKLTSRLLSGEYINYKDILPKDFEISLKTDKKQLLASLERAVLIATDDKKCPVLFEISRDKIVISSNTSAGTIRDEVSVEGNKSNMEIGFNPKYFIEALKVIDDEKIRISFTTDIGPCIITPEEGDNFKYMILPIRIREDE